jgi:methylmalonyl-CoA/ethylmalonyl-CoA epimerase
MASVTSGRLRQVALHAADLDRAVAFYRDVLGLRFVARFDPPGLAFFDLDGIRLLLEEGAPPSLLYLEVADIAAAHAALGEAGETLVDEPHVIFRDDEGLFGAAGTEIWQAAFRDSEDNLVVLEEGRAAAA